MQKLTIAFMHAAASAAVLTLLITQPKKEDVMQQVNVQQDVRQDVQQDVRSTAADENMSARDESARTHDQSAPTHDESARTHNEFARTHGESARTHDETMQVRVRGEGPPVVLVGGGLTGWSSWEPHVAELEQTRTVALAQPLNVQYGLEDRPLPPDYGIPMEAGALERALERIDLREPVDVVGWSYGALVALEFVLEHPERIRTLTLIEPPAFFLLDDRGTGDPDVEAIRSLEIGHSVDADALEQFVRAVGIVPADADPRSLPQWEGWMKHRRSLRMLAVPLEFEGDPSRLADFDRPVLLVTGTGTAPFHRRIHDELAERLPQAVEIELPGGHAPHIVAMEPFLAELADFHAARYTVSKDGTRIGFVRRGGGPAVLMVHGTSVDRRSWLGMAPYLQDHVTLYAMDRRGRGLSGDAPAYDLAREAEDVAAVVEAIGEPVTLFGHSMGGLVALETARLTDQIDRLILYEPAVPGEELALPEEYVDRMATLVQRGDLEDAMRFFLQEIALIDDATLAAYEQTPLWDARIPVTATIPRELAIEKTYAFDPMRFAALDVPAFLLLGEESPAMYRAGVEAVHAALPQNEVVTLGGQQHAAHLVAPNLLARAILGSMGM